MTKIEKIELMDFRGFEGLRTFEFENADLIIFLGMNGFGKTSVFDAVEWCLTGHLSRYERYLEVGRKQDFAKEKKVLRNKYASDPNALVKIDLTNGTKFGRRVAVSEGEPDYGTGSIVDGYEYGLKAISNQDIDPALVHAYFSATHILSQETIHHFVTSKKPEDRYRALSVNFGTSLYEPFDDNAQKLLGVLKDEEKTFKIKLEENNKRLNDLKSQLKTEESEIQEQIKEANKIISELNKHSSGLQLHEYAYQDGNVVIKTGSKDDLQELISLKYTAIEELQKKHTIISSLSQDFTNWEAQNKELKELDKKVIENKELALKIKNLSVQLSTLQKEKSYAESILEKESADINIVQDIEDSLSKFLENNAQIVALTNKLEERQASAKQYQEKLVSITEIKITSEQELKQVGSKLKETRSVLQALEKELSDADLLKIKHEQTILRSRNIAETIDAERNKISILKEIENIINLDFDSFSEESAKVLMHLVSEFKKELWEQTNTTRSRLVILPNELKDIASKKSLAEAAYTNQADSLSRSKAFLTDALGWVNRESENSSCPVCEVMHETDHLITLIKSRLDSEETNALKALKDEISIFESELAKLRKEKEKLEESLEALKNIILKEIRLAIKSSTKIIDSSENSHKEIKDEIQQFEEERQNLITLLNSTLNEDVKDLEQAKAMLHRVIEDLVQHQAELDSKVDESNDIQKEIAKSIELQISENSLAQERISSLRTADFEKINIFLIENGVSIGPKTQAQVNEFLTAKRETYKQQKVKIENIIKEIVVSEKQLADVRSERTEAQIDKDTVTLSARINEITRFLSDYKERCTRVNINLGDVNMLLLEVKKNEALRQIEDELKTKEWLSALLAKVKDFSIFLRENTVRKKLTLVEAESADLKTQIQRVGVARKEIENLKQKFPKVLEQYIKKNLDVDLFNKIYQSLNPHRRFKNIDFKVNVSHNKVGINFNAKHSTINGRPEFLFSSAQLNTFGVSMFLSMALRQNWLNLDTVLLDDPIQNLDDINVLSLIDLIRGLLDLKTGKQVMLSTHDERFYNLVKKKFADYNLKAYKFESYGMVASD